MNLVDRAFKIWERNNQPRRAKTRTMACSNSVDCASMLMQRAKVQSALNSDVAIPAIEKNCTIRW